MKIKTETLSLNKLDTERYVTFLTSTYSLQTRHFLTENNRGCTGVELDRQGASYVIPFSTIRTITDHVTTFLIKTAWISSAPCCVTGQRSVICPIELRVCFTVESQPHSIQCDCALLAKKIKDELIFSGRCDLSEVCTELLTFFSSIVAMYGWSINDEVTRIPVENPAVWTD